MRAKRAGFTLIEVMAVVFFTAIVITAAVSFFIDLTGASNRATEQMSATRRAVGILDRVARDLETAILVRKPDAEDSINWPWVFVAEAQGSNEGADRIKFVHLGRAPRASGDPESDLELISYVTEPGANDDVEIWRWSSSQLPESLDRSMPGPSDPGTLLLAREIASFGLRFLDEEGGWNDEWDSSLATRSGELPIAVEIRIAVYRSQDDDQAETLVRRVMIPVRPIDVAELQGDGEGGSAGDEDGDGEEDEDDEDTANDDPDDCIKVSECIAVFGDVLQSQGYLEQAQAVAGECAANYAGLFPGFDPSQCR